MALDVDQLVILARRFLSERPAGESSGRYWHAFWDWCVQQGHLTRDEYDKVKAVAARLVDAAGVPTASSPAPTKRTEPRRGRGRGQG